MTPDLALLTVNYNNYEITKKFVHLFREQDTTSSIFIADASQKKRDISYGKNTFLFSIENKGYAYGINRAIKEAQKKGCTKYIVINNDTRVSSSFSSACMNRFEKTPHSIVGGKIYYEKGYEYHHSYKESEKGNVLWYAGGEVDYRNAFTSHKGVDEVDKGQYNQFEKTDFVTGCLMLFDKHVIDTVGFWDEKYFLYYEDADFCERAKRKRIALYYDPEIVIWHMNAQSTGGSGSPLHAQYQKTNQLRYGLKYMPLRTKLHLIKNTLWKA